MTLASQLLLASIALMFSSYSVHASAQSAIIQISTPGQDVELSGNFEAAVQFRVSSVALLQLKQGSWLQIQVAGDEFADLIVSEIGQYLNGDRVIHAISGNGSTAYSLALTIGNEYLFGNLVSQEETYQITGARRDDEFEGRIVKPVGLVGASGAFKNDYIIPDTDVGNLEVAPPDLEIRSTLPYRTTVPSHNTSGDKVAANSVNIDAGNFEINQRFAHSPVIAGNNVEAEISFRNISTEFHHGLAVEFYFMLENSQLISAPAQCREQLSLSAQDVLYCELGDFAPGEVKTLSYTLATSEQSKPYIISSPIIGNLRLDTYVNVVDDVRTDSDGDGISDFNESLMGTDPRASESVDRGNTVIDVMALYTPGASALYPRGVDTRINQLISVANQIYQDSGVAITLRPVYHGEVGYNDSDDMDTALDHLIYKTDPTFSEVDLLRQTYGADLVMLFRPLGNETGRCGLAPVGGFNTNGDFRASTEADFAYSTMAIDCPDDVVVAHELGHNMGLTHSHLEDGAGGTFSFSTGYGIDSQFVTVMAYPAAFNTEARVSVFSSPDLDCLGFACGIDSDSEFGADAVQSLNLVRQQISNYFPTVVPDLPTARVSAISGASTSATIRIAASTDNGLSFSDTAALAEAVDVVANIQVDPVHAGQAGSIHVLIGSASKGFFQLDEFGAVVPWDGTAPGLRAASESRVLESNTRLNILDNFKFDATLLGEQILIYVAYQVAATGEIIYTVNPMILEVVQSSAASGMPVN